MTADQQDGLPNTGVAGELVEISRNGLTTYHLLPEGRPLTRQDWTRLTTTVAATDNGSEPSPRAPGDSGWPVPGDPRSARSR